MPPPDTRAHLFLVHFSPGFVSTLGFPGWEGCREAMEPARGGWVPVVSPATTQTEGQVDMHTRGTRSTFLNLSLLICKLRLRHHHGYLVVFLFFSQDGVRMPREPQRDLCRTLMWDGGDRVEPHTNRSTEVSWQEAKTQSICIFNRVII